ncbi:hypothetical protein J2W30_004553 [Variovorax boronicumulans]|uniref:hypothetical protein n=1 Tax=Variovorax boronicumulans TaxID=436515 RepID=UPI00277D54E9|nr:hypothetical protein [Variovorax boronicumulans]MDQ0036778.1 hypothetical protein [Variovorax boronicumulans]MDQ0044545.1 hypothetical protein [Variovorax boronicumulans]
MLSQTRGTLAQVIQVQKAIFHAPRSASGVPAQAIAAELGGLGEALVRLGSWLGRPGDELGNPSASTR